MKAFKLLVVFLFFVASCGTENNSSSHLVSKAEDYDLSQTQTSQDGLFEVTYTTTPNPLPLNDYFDMAVTLTEAEVSTDELVLGVDAKMPEHNHGMNVLPEFEMGGRGKLAVKGMLFHMPGHWEITVQVTRGETSDSVIFNVYLEP